MLLHKEKCLSMFILGAVLWQPLTVLADDIPSYKLTSKAGHFYPEVIEVQAGRKFSVAFTNEGPGPEEFHSNDLKKEVVVVAGATRVIKFNPLKPGTYKFMGEMHMDTANGQIVAK